MSQRNRVLVTSDCTLVVIRDHEPYVELRPHYMPRLGPTLTLYKVNGLEPIYLCTLPVGVIGRLVQKLPITIAAARRLAARATQPVTNGAVEPNSKPDSSSA